MICLFSIAEFLMKSLYRTTHSYFLIRKVAHAVKQPTGKKTHKRSILTQLHLTSDQLPQVPLPVPTERLAGTDKHEIIPSAGAAAPRPEPQVIDAVLLAKAFDGVDPLTLTLALGADGVECIIDRPHLGLVVS